MELVAGAPGREGERREGDLARRDPLVGGARGAEEHLEERCSSREPRDRVLPEVGDREDRVVALDARGAPREGLVGGEVERGDRGAREGAEEGAAARRGEPLRAVAEHEDAPLAEEERRLLSGRSLDERDRRGARTLDALHGLRRGVRARKVPGWWWLLARRGRGAEAVPAYLDEPPRAELVEVGEDLVEDARPREVRGEQSR